MPVWVRCAVASIETVTNHLPPTPRALTSGCAFYSPSIFYIPSVRPQAARWVRQNGAMFANVLQHVLLACCIAHERQPVRLWARLLVPTMLHDIHAAESSSSHPSMQHPVMCTSLLQHVLRLCICMHFWDVTHLLLLGSRCMQKSALTCLARLVQRH